MVHYPQIMRRMPGHQHPSPNTHHPAMVHYPQIMRKTLGLMLFAAAALPGAEEGFLPLFNGKNLDGWQIDTPGVWSVRDGMIVGKHAGQKWNDFLRTRKDYEN